jgi:y4mF family transcriptional regulator
MDANSPAHATTDASTGLGSSNPMRRIARWTDLGWAIRDARTVAGLTQHDLADRAGVSRAWLARVEAGHRRAEIELLIRTLDALGLSLSLGPTPAADADDDPELDEALRLAGLE